MIIYLLSILSFAWAQAPLSCENLFSTESLVYLNENPITFSQVEVFRRNNDIGIQQKGEMHFEQWSELTFEYLNTELDHEEVANIIGRTPDGRIYHLIKYQQRTLARLLSGDMRFTHFELSNKGRLVAWNDQGQSWAYSPELWSLSPKKTVLKTWAKLWGLTTAPLVLGKIILIEDFNFQTEILGMSLSLPLIEIFMASVVAMSSGFAMLSKYEHLNTYPNGFIPLPEPLMHGAWVQSILSTENPNGLEHFAVPELSELAPTLEQTEEIH
jgi:hypothetical protein